MKMETLHVLSSMVQVRKISLYAASSVVREIQRFTLDPKYVPWCMFLVLHMIANVELAIKHYHHIFVLEVLIMLAMILVNPFNFNHYMAIFSRFSLDGKFEDQNLTRAVSENLARVNRQKGTL
jgi:hypothetical protein